MTTREACPCCNRAAEFERKTIAISQDVERTFLECSECGYTRTLAYTDSEARTMMLRQKAAFNSGKRSKIKYGSERLEQKMQELMERYEPSEPKEGTCK